MSFLQAIDRVSKWSSHNRQTESFKLGGRTVRPSFLEANEEHNHDISSLRWDPFEMVELQEYEHLKGQYEFYVAAVTGADGQLQGALTVFDKQSQQRIFSGDINEGEKNLSIQPHPNVEGVDPETIQMLGNLIGQEIAGVRNDLDRLDHSLSQDNDLSPEDLSESFEPAMSENVEDAEQKRALSDRINDQLTVSPKGLGKAAKNVLVPDAVKIENAIVDAGQKAGEKIRQGTERIGEGAQNLKDASFGKIAQMRQERAQNRQEKKEMKAQMRAEAQQEIQDAIDRLNGPEEVAHHDAFSTSAQDMDNHDVLRADFGQQKEQEMSADLTGESSLQAKAGADSLGKMVDVPAATAEVKLSEAELEMENHPVLNGNYTPADPTQPKLEKIPEHKMDQTQSGVAELGDPPVIEPIQKVFDNDQPGVYDWQQAGVFQEPEQLQMDFEEDPKPAVYDWEKDGGLGH